MSNYEQNLSILALAGLGDMAAKNMVVEKPAAQGPQPEAIPMNGGAEQQPMLPEPQNPNQQMQMQGAQQGTGQRKLQAIMQQDPKIASLVQQAISENPEAEQQIVQMLEQGGM